MNHRPPELGAKLAFFYLVIISFCVLLRDIAVAAWDAFVDWAQYILQRRRDVWKAYR